MKSLLFSLWFFLPAGLANAAPVFANKIPYLNKWKTPLDFGLQWRGQRLLGDNKTWRGFCFGVAVGILVCMLQKQVFLHSSVQSLAFPVDYSSVNVILLGSLLSVGALTGDALESLIKRRVGVKPGESWFPFDQLDYIIGGLVLSLPLVRLSFADYALIIFIWFTMHLIASYIGWLLHLKEKPI